jgi:hypothetical protein
MACTLPEEAGLHLEIHNRPLGRFPIKFRLNGRRAYA